jgi:hypothetical protein
MSVRAGRLVTFRHTFCEFFFRRVVVFGVWGESAAVGEAEGDETIRREGEGAKTEARKGP